LAALGIAQANGLALHSFAQNLKQYMGNSENPVGTNIINNLTALKFFSIAMAIQKNLCLASLCRWIFYMILRAKRTKIIL